MTLPREKITRTATTLRSQQKKPKTMHNKYSLFKDEEISRQVVQNIEHFSM